MPSEVRFSNNLTAFRRSMRLNQRQLADRLGIKRSRLSLWENGRALPAWDNAMMLVAFYQVSLGDLFPVPAIQDLIARSRRSE